MTPYSSEKSNTSLSYSNLTNHEHEQVLLPFFVKLAHVSFAQTEYQVYHAHLWSSQAIFPPPTWKTRSLTSLHLLNSKNLG